MDRLTMVRESKMSLSDYFPGSQNPETQHPDDRARPTLREN